ncbi:MAG: hypothetical protein AB1705_10615 [Verrucomicrobiota bacterium]
MSDYLAMHREMERPYERFERSLLGADFGAELETVSRLWFACGYRPGIGAYLNFFLLRDFIVLHDTKHPPRFRSFRNMADSFYQTDLFIREVTDSGLQPTGGISSAKVRAVLQGIMKRHQRLAIPEWMMTHFGFSLLENVEKQCGALTAEEKQRHLSYMNKTYRIMGVAFSADRALLERFARSVEEAHAALSPQVEKHARNILLLGEMIGVSSAYDSIAPMLVEKTRPLFREMYPRVRPSLPRRLGARLIGKALMKQAVGAARRAVPVEE